MSVYVRMCGVYACVADGDGVTGSDGGYTA